ncbi:zinc-dependent alcohol dehydrogenase family protein [Lichenifustis flavocetrariae]|uniref:Zinc-dependent alcohol dehydrogenase family protein n=1 Tax=Lichenifustis flavocetrariae TaxID=2949735 RepID=A0AA42CN44_9HYPH|nr:zinc-dependent alcohol dehydrogenase family protein [Lichenifustis flavocetrariae]MCW6509005.1 zinc-dependent alcohol dehydrogenase family protein [Lichenifustis flavocetrariae]
MQIKAALLRQTGLAHPYRDTRPLAIEKVALAGPGRGEVLIRMKAAGLCHSDLSVIDGSRPRPMPMVLGHEAAGIVVEVGPDVSDLAVDDHVVLVFIPSCGQCLPCATGRPALCEPGAKANGAGTLLRGDRRLSLSCDAVNHHIGVSAFADHAVVSRESCVKVDKSLAFDHAALFGCAVLTGVGAVVNTAKVPAGASVAVAGLGGVGLSAILGAVACGARQIIAVDLSEEKLAFARQLGATHTVNAGTPDAVAAIKDLSGGGVEFFFEMAGAVPALELAYAATARGGTTVTAGLPHPDRKLSIQAVSLVAEERTLKGSYIGSCVPRRDLPHYVALFQNGRLPVDRLLTHRLKLDEINEGFDRLHDGSAIRQVVLFD